MEKTLFEAAGEDPLKAIEIKQMYLTDFMVWLSYMIEKGEAEEEEEKFQDNLRKARKGR